MQKTLECCKKCICNSGGRTEFGSESDEKVGLHTETEDGETVCQQKVLKNKKLKKSFWTSCVCSSSGSDSSSLLSTLDSSSFSFRSDTSFSTKGDLSPSNNLPLTLKRATDFGTCLPSICTSNASTLALSKPVPVSIDKMTLSSDDHDLCEKPSDESYLEFNFFDGVMVECNNLNSLGCRPTESQMDVSKRSSTSRSGHIRNDTLVGGMIAQVDVRADEDHFSDVGRSPVCNSGTAGSDFVNGGRTEGGGSLPVFHPSSSLILQGETCSGCLQATYASSRVGVNANRDSSFPENFDKQRTSVSECGHIWSRNLESDINSTIEEEILVAGNKSVSCSSTCFQAKNIPLKKKVQFVSGETMVSSSSQVSSQKSTPAKQLGSILSDHLGFSPKHYQRHGLHQKEGLLHGPSHPPRLVPYRDHEIASNPGNLTAGCRDWLCCEVADGQGISRLDATDSWHMEGKGYNPYVCTSPFSRNRGAGWKEPGTPSCSAELSNVGLISQSASVSNSDDRRIWKEPAKGSGTSTLAAWVPVGRADSPWSSIVITKDKDLAETTIRSCPVEGPRSWIHGQSFLPVASSLELTGNVLAGFKFHNDTQKQIHLESKIFVEPIEAILPEVSESPLNQHSPVSISTSRKDFSDTSKLEPRSLSITDPVAHGTIHGLLHSSHRDGLPNYTFLLDDYEEVVTAKIWTEDMFLAEDGGAWRYTFYSLKGEGKKKGKAGWKHWRRKEKLASELVGKMKVSSILCSDPVDHVASEFVLFSARAHESSTISQTVSCSRLGLSSSETIPTGSPEAHYTRSPAATSSFHPLASPSTACSDMSSPGAVSAWYVSQSLLPRSLPAPVTAYERKKGFGRWNLQSGKSGAQNSQTRAKVGQSSSLLQTESTHRDSKADMTCNQSSELAAMVIRVPLERQDGHLAPEHSSSISVDGQQWHGKGQHERNVCRSQEVTTQDCGFTHLERTCNHFENKSQVQHRQANVTVILPAGNHGRPLSDSKGPPPLIERWKDGGKCDCKGWDLGCGLTVLSNQRQKPSMASEGNETEDTSLGRSQGQSKPLTLYKQDKDREEASLSLAPLNNGLISLEFQSPLSPLQAFAISVALLHGREPVVPSVHKSMPGEMAGKPKDHVQPATLHQSSAVFGKNFQTSLLPSVDILKLGELKVQRSSGHVQWSTCVNQDRSQHHEDLDATHIKIHGSDILSCTPDPPLSFERV